MSDDDQNSQDITSSDDDASSQTRNIKKNYRLHMKSRLLKTFLE